MGNLFSKEKRKPDSSRGKSRVALLHVGSLAGRKEVLLLKTHVNKMVWLTVLFTIPWRAPNTRAACRAAKEAGTLKAPHWAQASPRTLRAYREVTLPYEVDKLERSYTC